MLRPVTAAEGSVVVPERRTGKKDYSHDYDSSRYFSFSCCGNRSDKNAVFSGGKPSVKVAVSALAEAIEGMTTAMSDFVISSALESSLIQKQHVPLGCGGSEDGSGSGEKE